MSNATLPAPAVTELILPERGAEPPARPAPAAGPSFSSLGLPFRAVRVLADRGITVPTPVQAAVLPDALAGRDVLGRARTGSGKTLAFGLPVLARLERAARERGPRRSRRPRALVVVPTRELAAQVQQALVPLADALRLRVLTVYGGTRYDRQIGKLDRGVDVVVATPGRLKDLMDRGACRVDEVEVTVLDEADHLCDLGFFPTVSEILSRTPQGAQRLLLSATLDGDVDALARRFMSDPVRHELAPEPEAAGEMDHHVLVVHPGDKVEVAAQLVRGSGRALIFTRTRGGASDLAAELAQLGVPSVDLHGELSQRVRERNLAAFHSGRARALVATDVAARGIHVDALDLVVHFDPAEDHKSYLHRSGRTARAGREGTVVTLALPRQEASVALLNRRAGVQARHHDPGQVAGGLSREGLASSPGRPVRERRPAGGPPRRRPPGGGRRTGTPAWR